MQIKETRSIKRDVLKVAFDVRKPSLDDKRVDLFRTLLQAGVKFPPVQTYEKPNDTHLYVWEGHHRLEAYKQEEITEFEVTICTFDSDQEMYFEAFKANIVPGGGPKEPTTTDYKFFIRARMKDGMSQDLIVIELVKIGVNKDFASLEVRKSIKSDKEERLDNAMQAINTGEVSLNAAAKKFGVTPAELKKKINVTDLSTVEEFASNLVSTVKKGLDKLMPGIAEQGEELEHEAFAVVRRRLEELQRYVDANDPAGPELRKPRRNLRGLEKG